MYFYYRKNIFKVRFELYCSELVQCPHSGGNLINLICPIDWLWKTRSEDSCGIFSSDFPDYFEIFSECHSKWEFPIESLIGVFPKIWKFLISHSPYECGRNLRLSKKFGNFPWRVCWKCLLFPILYKYVWHNGEKLSQVCCK